MAIAPERELRSFALPAVAAMPPGGAPEPHFSAVPGVTSTPDRARLDPARAKDAGSARPVSSARPIVLPFALAGAIALHLLPLATFVAWPVAPAEIAPAIPVQLVVVQPPPPPPPPPAPRAKQQRPPPPREKQRPPPERLASEDMGSPKGERHGTGGDKAPAAAPKPVPPTPPQPQELVSDLPLPKPDAVSLPAPSDQDEQVAMLPVPAPPARPRRPEPPVPRVERVPGSWPLAPAHLGAPGPAATRDEYLAYCNALIKRHFGMLPPSFIAGRRGLTVLSLVVLDDGRIARIAVVRSSGYDDIDERAEKMIAAVGRFPPLPQRFQGEQITLMYELPIPGGLEGR